MEHEGDGQVETFARLVVSAASETYALGRRIKSVCVPRPACKVRTLSASQMPEANLRIAFLRTAHSYTTEGSCQSNFGSLFLLLRNAPVKRELHQSKDAVRPFDRPLKEHVLDAPLAANTPIRSNSLAAEIFPILSLFITTPSGYDTHP